MFNIFKKPFNRESLDSLCKILDDISKIELLAIPVVLYSPNGLFYKLFNSFVLLFSMYICLFMADFIRKNKGNLMEE